MLQLHTEHIAGQTTRTRTHTANLTSGAIRFLAQKVNIVFHRRRAPGVSAAETGDEGGYGYYKFSGTARLLLLFERATKRGVHARKLQRRQRRVIKFTARPPRAGATGANRAAALV